MKSRIFIPIFKLLSISVILLFSLLLAEKKCPKCGKVFPDEKRYCIYCGVKLVPVEKPKPKEIPAIKGKIEILEDSVIITSIPEGAAVYADGKYRANTPIKIGISPGSHTIKLTHPGYKDYIRTIEIGRKTIETILIKKCQKCGRWFGPEVLFLYCPYCEQEENPVLLETLTVWKEKVKQCPRCEFYFPDSFNFCPFCEEEDTSVSLIRIK